MSFSFDPHAGPGVMLLAQAGSPHKELKSVPKDADEQVSEPVNITQTQAFLEKSNEVQQNHGVALSIFGIIVVFLGLSLISFVISKLPQLIAAFQARFPNFGIEHGHGANAKPAVKPAKSAEPTSTAPAELDPKLLAAIIAVLHTEAALQAEANEMKVTIPINPSTTSPWALSNKMRRVPGRIR